MCKPDPFIYIPGPGQVLSSIPLRYVGGGLAVAGLVAFVVAHALLLGAVLAVFVAVMGGVLVLMRQPDWTQRHEAAPALPRNLAITRGPLAIEAPKAVLGQVVTAEAEKVAR